MAKNYLFKIAVISYATFPLRPSRDKPTEKTRLEQNEKLCNLQCHYNVLTEI